MGPKESPTLQNTPARMGGVRFMLKHCRQEPTIATVRKNQGQFLIHPSELVSYCAAVLPDGFCLEVPRPEAQTDTWRRFKLKQNLRLANGRCLHMCPSELSKLHTR